MTRKVCSLSRMLAAAGVGILISISAPVGYADTETARLAVPAQAVTKMPTLLKAEDADAYRRIFSLQADGNWRAADKIIKQVADPLLMGHVLHQRLMHPNKYRASYKELKEWMDAYADHPDADRVYSLALKRRPANWKAPRKPERLRYVAYQGERSSIDRIRIPGKQQSASERSRARTLVYRIKRALRRGHTLVAKRYIETADFKRLLSTAQKDEAKAQLAKGYFIDGRDDWALEWLLPALERSGEYLPEGHWTAGLLLWRAEKYADAARHFQAAAENPKVSGWMASASAFWAARSFNIAREPGPVLDMLERAASEPRTFYGLLATRLLGRDLPFKWTPPAIEPATYTELMASSRARRAMALMQVGEDVRAEEELKEIARGGDPEILRGLHALAARGNMASLASRLDRMLYPNGGGFDGAAYPIPDFVPPEGFSVDRALIYALIRQESAFNPKAKSWAGARGLMQLMPGTARFVARSTGITLKNRSKLYTPETNLELGQAYIEMLLDESDVAGNLFKLAVAWNGGPGNLRKWKRRTKYLDDPIFFIESIPSYETRTFVERVLTNFWIYRHRFGQDTPSLDAVARGEWPLYTALGHGDHEVATNAPRK